MPTDESIPDPSERLRRLARDYQMGIQVTFRAFAYAIGQLEQSNEPGVSTLLARARRALTQRAVDADEHGIYQRIGIPTPGRPLSQLISDRDLPALVAVILERAEPDVFEVAEARRLEANRQFLDFLKNNPGASHAEAAKAAGITLMAQDPLTKIIECCEAVPYWLKQLEPSAVVILLRDLTWPLAWEAAGTDDAPPKLPAQNASLDDIRRAVLELRQWATKRLSPPVARTALTDPCAILATLRREAAARRQHEAELCQFDLERKRRLDGEMRYRQELEHAFNRAYQFTKEESQDGRKPSKESFHRWADRWIEAGTIMRKCDQAMPHLRLVDQLHTIVVQDAPGELKYACALLLLAAEGQRDAVAVNLEQGNLDGLLRYALLWLPYILDNLWYPLSDNRITVAPVYTNPEEAGLADKAFGWILNGGLKNCNADASLKEEADERGSDSRHKAQHDGTEANNDIEWTTADGPTQWAKLFGISSSTFKRRCKDGKIRHKKLSDKSYQVAVTDLPAKHQAKFTNPSNLPPK